MFSIFNLVQTIFAESFGNKNILIMIIIKLVCIQMQYLIP